MYAIQSGHSTDYTPTDPSEQYQHAKPTNSSEVHWANVFKHNFLANASDALSTSTVPQWSPERIAAEKERMDWFAVDDELRRYENETVEREYWECKLSVIHYWQVCY
jgi:hypothetical protein